MTYFIQFNDLKLESINVHAYEEAKLRLLNGAHSALAYLGLKDKCLDQ